MSIIQILYAREEQIAEDCFVVFAQLGGGRYMVHNGPVRYPYFSKDQAEGLAANINCFKQIDTAFWNNDHESPVDWEGKEEYNLECELMEG